LFASDFPEAFPKKPYPSRYAPRFITYFHQQLNNKIGRDAGFPPLKAAAFASNSPIRVAAKSNRPDRRTRPKPVNIELFYDSGGALSRAGAG
jgi:hypothetical protein